jgi:hypothetical protein
MNNPRMVSTREIAGKRIERIEYTSRRERDGRLLHLDVSLHLEDGSLLYFVTEEAFDGDTYGTFVGRSLPIREAR